MHHDVTTQHLHQSVGGDGGSCSQWRKRTGPAYVCVKQSTCFCLRVSACGGSVVCYVESQSVSRCTHEGVTQFIWHHHVTWTFNPETLVLMLSNTMFFSLTHRVTVRIKNFNMIKVQMNLRGRKKSLKVSRFQNLKVTTTRTQSLNCVKEETAPTFIHDETHLEVDVPPAISHRGQRDHSSSPQLLQTLQQQAGQQEVTQVVHPELDAETVLGPSVGHQTCSTSTRFHPSVRLNLQSVFVPVVFCLKCSKHCYEPIRT